jgi:hypothetical protein
MDRLKERARLVRPTSWLVRVGRHPTAFTSTGALGCSSGLAVLPGQIQCSCCLNRGLLWWFMQQIGTSVCGVVGEDVTR